jgi:glycosyltransferase involved in cell wall biosynthesis
MDNQTPLVSMGLPVYNGENFVAEAIECALSQTRSDWELIVSDNASTDRTVSICREYAAKDSRIRVYQNERNMGVSLNYNYVFQRSRGRYFKWITHDDLFGAEFVERCILELEKDDRVVLSFPKLVYVDAGGGVLRRQTSELSISGPTAESRVNQLMRLEAEGTDIFWSQFGLIRRDVLEETGLMGLYNGSDQVLLFELALRGSFKQVEGEFFFRREHPAASTLRSGWTAKERAMFVYADDGRTLVFPYCRMLKEHVVSICNSTVPFWSKAQCTAAVLKRFLGHWKYFAHEVIETPLEVLRAKWRVA